MAWSSAQGLTRCWPGFFPSGGLISEACVSLLTRTQYCFLRSQDSWSLASSESAKGEKVSLLARWSLTDCTTFRRVVFVTIAVSCGLEARHGSCSGRRGGDSTKAQHQAPGLHGSVCHHPLSGFYYSNTFSCSRGLPRFLSLIVQTLRSSAPHWN